MSNDNEVTYLDDTEFVDWCGNRGIDLEEVDDIAQLYRNYVADRRYDEEE